MSSIPAGPTRFSYQPALDGIRGAAVIVIMLYHGDVSWMGGGFVTVDSFFVLSGFLITSLLLIEYRNKSRIALREFWARRARRLLPALFLMLAGVLLYSSLVSSDISAERLRGDTLSTLGYVSNWRYILTGASYFDQFVIPSPLRHTWTLAIEEQWYVLWPLILPVLLTVSRARLSRLLLVLGAIATASAAFMAWIYVPGTDPSRVYYGTDTRLQALLVGAAVAVILVWRPGPRTAVGKGALQGAGVAAAAFCVWAAFSMGETSLFYFRGGLAAFAVAVGVVIAATVQPESTPLKRMLSWDRIRWVGLLSYGLYLWHWPVYVFVNAETLGRAGFPLLVVRFALSFSLAIASYYLVELPIRRGEFFRRRTWALSGAGLATLAALVLVMTSGTVFAGRTSNASALASFEVSDTPPEVEQAEDPERVLVVGDSVAATMGGGLERLGESRDLVVWNRGHLGCGLVVGGEAQLGDVMGEDRCGDVDAEWQGAVASFRPDLVVYLSAPWDVLDRRIDGQWYRPGTPEYAQLVRRRLEEATRVLTTHGAELVFLTGPYIERTEARRLQYPGGDFLQFGEERIDAFNEIVRDHGERSTRAKVLDLNRHLSPGGEYVGEFDGVVLRSDGVHFTDGGADLVAEWLLDQLEEPSRTTESATASAD